MSFSVITIPLYIRQTVDTTDLYAFVLQFGSFLIVLFEHHEWTENIVFTAWKTHRYREEERKRYFLKTNTFCLNRWVKIGDLYKLLRFVIKINFNTEFNGSSFKISNKHYSLTRFKINDKSMNVTVGFWFI